MDLSPFRFVDDMHEPFAVVVHLLLLALLPFAATVVTNRRLHPASDRPATDHPATPLVERLLTLRLLGSLLRRVMRLGRWVRLALLAIPVAIAIQYDRIVLGELLQLPHGILVALAAIVTGVLLAMLATIRPRPRALTRAVVVWGVVVIAGAILFSRQFVAPGGAHDSDPGDDGALPPAAVPTAPATVQGQGPAATPPAGAATTSPPARPVAVYDPARIETPTGSYETTDGGICLSGRGEVAVGVRVTGLAAITATLPDGTLVQVDDIAGLHPCAASPADAEQLHRAPAGAITPFGGAAPSRDLTVAVAGRMTTSGGEALVWVWHRTDGKVDASGVVRADQLRAL